MGRYKVAYEANLRFYPNYSFEIGDVNGDGWKELISLNHNGNRLRVVDLEGEAVFEVRLKNHGNWGTPTPCAIDLNADGCEEVVVPSFGKRFEARVVCIDRDGEQISEHSFGSCAKDDYGIGVPLIAPVRLDDPGVLAAVAGGSVVALDSDMEEIWRKDGFRNDFGHEFHVFDIDGDGRDEIAFCTMDHINHSYHPESNRGEFVVLDHDGSELLRRRVDSYVRDTHFDDVAVADFTGKGRTEILLEKGILLDLSGEVVWDISDEFDHGQWIAHAPDPEGPGRIIFISELWGSEGRSGFFSGDGRRITDIYELPRSSLASDEFPGWMVLPTRCHFVRWDESSPPELFLGEQACSPTSHDCFATRSFDLKCFFLDLSGELQGTVPFRDSQVEGYWYNGEVRSRVADVDGDGCEEVVFPRQDGHAMIVKRGGAD